jgi:hypothetical protein
MVKPTMNELPLTRVLLFFMALDPLAVSTKDLIIFFILWFQRSKIDSSLAQLTPFLSSVAFSVIQLKRTPIRKTAAPTFLTVQVKKFLTNSGLGASTVSPSANTVMMCPNSVFLAPRYSVSPIGITGKPFNLVGIFSIPSSCIFFTLGLMCFSPSLLYFRVLFAMPPTVIQPLSAIVFIPFTVIVFLLAWGPHNVLSLIVI